LTKNLDKALELYSDVVLNAAFPDREFDNYKRRALVGFQQRRVNANATAGVVYNSLLYGKDHPYGNPIGGTEASVKAISRSDIENYHRTYYRPNNAVLIVAGDVTSGRNSNEHSETGSLIRYPRRRWLR
jgi:zinc protease